MARKERLENALAERADDLDRCADLFEQHGGFAATAEECRKAAREMRALLSEPSEPEADAEPDDDYMIEAVMHLNDAGQSALADEVQKARQALRQRVPERAHAGRWKAGDHVELPDDSVTDKGPCGGMIRWVIGDLACIEVSDGFVHLFESEVVTQRVTKHHRTGKPLWFFTSAIAQEESEPNEPEADAADQRRTWYPVECEHGYDHCPKCDGGATVSEPEADAEILRDALDHGETVWNAAPAAFDRLQDNIGGLSECDECEQLTREAIYEIGQDLAVLCAFIRRALRRRVPEAVREITREMRAADHEDAPDGIALTPFADRIDRAIAQEESDG